MPDDRLETPSCFESSAEVVRTREDIGLAGAAVLGDRSGTGDVHLLRRARTATGLPTLCRGCPVRCAARRCSGFANRLPAAGVPVDLHLYARAFHAWDRFAATSALARSSELTWRDYLRRRLHA
ncbi:hypothetical protein OHS18_01240 [Amycolatopsis sp. NBC_00355]|uniref:hypothetical protein n=1 Tax=Amycolatopsis sp. NBC_00355 TaxID=2975957 RepID=UPI002E2709B2